MTTRLALLLLPLIATDAGFLGTGRGVTPKPSIPSTFKPGLMKAPSVPSAPAAPRREAIVRSRPFLVPALSYGGLTAVAAGAGKLVAAAGYSGATIAGMSMPLVTLAAIAAPAMIMFAEFRFFGGGERVATMMGGKPADARLTALAESVAMRAGLAPPAHVFEIQTDELNAFAAGFGKADATVAVTSGLRHALTEKELEAVIAHEIGHIRHSDMRTNMHVAVAIAGLGGVYELGRMLIRSDSRRDKSSTKRKKDESGGSVLPLGVTMMAAGAASRLVGRMLQLSMSRSAEFDADDVAAELCGSDAMISALSKIQKEAEARKARKSSASWFPSSSSPKQPALSSFRGGAFAHAYISDGKGDAEHGQEGWWGRLKQALSTHPTTERRIAALRASGRSRGR